MQAVHQLEDRIVEPVEDKHPHQPPASLIQRLQDLRRAQAPYQAGDKRHQQHDDNGKAESGFDDHADDCHHDNCRGKGQRAEPAPARFSGILVLARLSASRRVILHFARGHFLNTSRHKPARQQRDGAHGQPGIQQIVRVALGCLPSLGLSLVPGIVTDFYQQNANLVMTLSTEHTEMLIKKLALLEIDLALTLQPCEQGDILSHPIADVPLVYIDRDYRQGSVNIEEIDQRRWISPGNHSLSSAIAQHRHFSMTRLNVQTYYMATEFVKRGMGCSITDIFSARNNLPPQMIHPLTPAVKVTLCLLRRGDISLSPVAQKFVDFLCQTLRQQIAAINSELYPENKKSIAPCG
ncbi:hypothetical protein RJ492_004869 [Pluralibacter gergoviae]|uniref:LysR substrate-binding domain-containing protein n=1 Tax=Pluralibacter gergoviae TaxID=61647 RepID=A0AAI9DM66_PLUGE|nr:hypothetical protein [Pluralibacter gergoviae]EKV9910652.1 hypothetical protein [Pluralibacter gergoviae]EKW7276624.1 hypothetical protein [Pluralibacter gergoviae]ELD4298214.1 hypothetical protein [Pluralibacter gergoviae]ELD4308906.1 hypothetical protein [Pluralibacter gergoviae]